MSTRDWITFWNSKHSIYVNVRHCHAHYRRIADDIRRTVPAGGAVLDYGCGEALFADRVAEHAGRLVLCEATSNVRATLTTRFSGSPKIEVRAPEQIAEIPDGTFDVIVMHSVAQYLTLAVLDELLARFRRLLKPGGLLVLGDVIPLKITAVTDGLALLCFGASEGFFGAAILGLVRTAFSSYWQLRTTLGIARYSEADMLAKLKDAGYLPKRSAENIGHNPARMTFLAWAV